MTAGHLEGDTPPLPPFRGGQGGPAPGGGPRRQAEDGAGGATALSQETRLESTGATAPLRPSRPAGRPG